MPHIENLLFSPCNLRPASYFTAVYTLLCTFKLFLFFTISNKAIVNNLVHICLYTYIPTYIHMCLCEYSYRISSSH